MQGLYGFGAKDLGYEPLGRLQRAFVHDPKTVASSSLKCLSKALNPTLHPEPQKRPLKEPVKGTLLTSASLCSKEAFEDQDRAEFGILKIPKGPSTSIVGT